MDIVERKDILTGKVWKRRFVKILDNVFTPDECDFFINLSNEHKYVNATLNNGTLNTDKRNCLRVMIDDKEIANNIYERIKEYIPEKPYSSKYKNMRRKELNERLRFIRYDDGHFMDKHKDGIFNRIDDPNYDSNNKSYDDCDMSFYTIIIYLNDGYDGGETSFIRRSKSGGIQEYIIKPVKGRVLIFQHNLLHEGKLLKGNIPKYIIRTDVMYSYN